MIRLARRLLLLAALLVPGVAIPAPEVVVSDAGDRIARASTDKPFDDVVMEIEFAITERNYRITGRNSIGKGLRDRGYEGFPDVEVIHFCNLENAREVLLLDPDFVALMPCRITVHVADHRTIVSAILLPETHEDPRVVAFAKRLNGEIRDILEYVVGK